MTVASPAHGATTTPSGIAPAAACQDGQQCTPALASNPCTGDSCPPSTEPLLSLTTEEITQDSGENSDLVAIMVVVFVFLGLVWSVPFLILRRGGRRQVRGPDAVAARSASRPEISD